MKKIKFLSIFILGFLLVGCSQNLNLIGSDDSDNSKLEVNNSENTVVEEKETLEENMKKNSDIGTPPPPPPFVAPNVEK